MEEGLCNLCLQELAVNPTSELNRVLGLARGGLGPQDAHEPGDFGGLTVLRSGSSPTLHFFREAWPGLIWGGRNACPHMLWQSPVSVAPWIKLENSPLADSSPAEPIRRAAGAWAGAAWDRPKLCAESLPGRSMPAPRSC